MRGPIQGVDPLLAPLLFTFIQTREELELHTSGLTAEQVWMRPHGLAPLGFHLRHIAGSVDRLAAYLRGRPLSDPQREALEKEMEPGAGPAELLAAIDGIFRQVEGVVRGLDAARLTEWRGVGRKQLPATAIGLLVHIAEHTQRHLGQAIVMAKLVRALSR